MAPEMVAIASAHAARRAQAGGATVQVTARVLDLEQIDMPDDSFDIVVCREGLMFALDPDGAAREIARVLRPGGRAAIAVWGPRDRNPWLGVLADAVYLHTGIPVPPTGTPGPFSRGVDGALETTLTAAGLAVLSAQDVIAIREMVREGLARYQSADELIIPGLAYVGSERRSVAAHRPKARD